MIEKVVTNLSDKKPVLGINGLGRIGKLTLWHHIGRKEFSEIVVNIGRKVGTKLQDVALYIEKDSTYRSMQSYLYGYKAKRLITDINEEKGSMLIDGVPVFILREARNPRDIPWKKLGVKLVVDATGKYTDPTLSSDAKNGACRGHLEAGAEKVIVSAPFKIKEKGRPMPDDAKTIISGINDDEYDHARHNIVSAASCTTTCLAYMVKPLLDYFGPGKMLSLSMATVHAATGSQEVLDRLPKEGATDLRKNRSIMNNIILTSTGAARTLALVLPEMNKIGFIAQSVRVPIATGSLIILVIAMYDEEENPLINRALINKIYFDAAERETKGYIKYTDEQNVSSDIIANYGPAVIIEGNETHTRTAVVTLDASRFYAKGAIPEGMERNINVPITQAVIYGWYDNELGSYTNMLGDLTAKMCSNVY
ncbi:MAG TPA: glyceraldehyde 3-phosphate dehydrogenase NAD-binding domain-containing protein [Dissulfurispiraceae bacterium]|nr:glyceraldehyde 3-phosphate dehydrogenase NAD-binding domain-containing protein [Dissulfurispiraceae bacterium]